MKRLLPILFLLCLAAGEAKLEWQDTGQTWTIDGKTMSCSDGDLVAKIDPAEDLVITGQLRIESFSAEPRLASVVKVAILFRDHKTADGCAYYALGFRPDGVTLYRIVEAPQGNVCSLLGVQKTMPPLGKWIKFKIAVAGDKIQAAFSLTRGLTIVAKDPAPFPAGGVRLRSTATKVAFQDIKIKPAK